MAECCRRAAPEAMIASREMPGNRANPDAGSGPNPLDTVNVGLDAFTLASTRPAEQKKLSINSYLMIDFYNQPSRHHPQALRFYIFFSLKIDF